MAQRRLLVSGKIGPMFDGAVVATSEDGGVIVGQSTTNLYTLFYRLITACIVANEKVEGI